MIGTFRLTRVALLGGVSMAMAMAACPVFAADAPAPAASANGASKGT
jgi:hypothetical protein